MPDRGLRLLMAALFALVGIASVLDVADPQPAQVPSSPGEAHADRQDPAGARPDAQADAQADGTGATARGPDSLRPRLAGTIAFAHVDASGPEALAEPWTGNALTAYRELLPAAEAGNGQARYRLATVLRSCAGAPADAAEIRFTLARNEFRLDRDVVGAELESRLARCGGLNAEVDNPMAAATAWVERAAQAGDPVALADVALSAGEHSEDGASDTGIPARLREALRARPADALPLAGRYVAARLHALEAGTAPGAAGDARELRWASNAWWLAECSLIHACARQQALSRLRAAYLGYEVDEILSREQLIHRSIEQGRWSEETLALLGLTPP